MERAFREGLLSAAGERLIGARQIFGPDLGRLFGLFVRRGLYCGKQARSGLSSLPVSRGVSFHSARDELSGLTGGFSLGMVHCIFCGRMFIAARALSGAS